jgi:hypothetical protein
MHFRIHGLPAEQFAPLFALSDDALKERGAVRSVADDGGLRLCLIRPTGWARAYFSARVPGASPSLGIRTVTL